MKKFSCHSTEGTWAQRCGVLYHNGLMCFDNSEFRSVCKQNIQSLLQSPGS